MDVFFKEKTPQYALPVFTSVSEAANYLAAQSGGASAGDPVRLRMNIELSAAGWSALLSAIDASGKYVNLDLSTCTRSTDSTGGGLYGDGTFDPYRYSSTGKNLVVNISLPGTAAEIAASGNLVLPSFQYFTSLQSVSATNVTIIGNNAFTSCTSLSSVNFPAATSIGGNAFSYCISLNNMNFPAVINIGSTAFGQCNSLRNVSFPLVTSINDGVFSECRNLNSVSFPVAMSIGDYAFEICTSLSSANFPEATSIGSFAFSSCTSLSSANFPEAISIGSYAFSTCTSLSSTNFPEVISIGNYAFASTGGTPLTITFGNPAPSVGTNVCSGSVKTVTVRYPGAATGYGTVPTDTITTNWGNAFRGMGWDGTSYLGGTASSYITLVYQPW